MSSKRLITITFLLFLFSFFKFGFCQKNKTLYKCGVNEDTIKPIVGKEIPFNDSELLKRKRNLDSDGFKDFKIYFDPVNLINDINIYNLTEYQDLFLNGIQHVIETLQKLLRVKPFQGDYIIDDMLMKSMYIDKWDTELFGPDNSRETNEGVKVSELGYDLIIFGKLEDLGGFTLARAGARRIDSIGRPYVGLLTINYDIDYSYGKSQEYFESIIIHEFTHILGFSPLFFDDNLFFKNDSYGITRAYINSTKVLEVARKYFDCPYLEGVPLEEYGGSGTVGSHWEAKVLLGDYMNGYIHPEEQVISEFTLALLEDSGFYKPNYYTGGLMRYGKHKGCSFVFNDCVDKTNHSTNPLFENEFFDSIFSSGEYDPSCSSGRLSRTYFFFETHSNLSESYTYFEDKTIGGLAPADYCPVAQGIHEYDDEVEYYSYRCSEKGTGTYGEYIYYYNDNSGTFTKTNDELNSIIGEVLSNKSFCFLSSLIKNGMEDIDIYTSIPRAICYELFCSERSLTVQLHDDYIVCPRAGGKIKVEGYEGYFLCPDYNLMCSGTVICNDMFDCVDKKSEVKNSSYYYDYEIKTSQNIDRAEIEEDDNITNYELSENATCPINCKHCKENKKCMKCRNNYGFVGNYENETIECLDLNDLISGYYKLENDIYYKCMNNCEICSNLTICEKCYNNFELKNSKCTVIGIENCKDYNEEGECTQCNENYAFNRTDRNKCINIEIFSGYYSLDDGISYYPCDLNITDCKNCNYDKTNSKLECNLCKDDYILVTSENKCYNKDDLDKNRSYLYINETHAEKCSEKIENCGYCDNKDKCIKCLDNYYLFNNETKICYEKGQIPIENCYLNEENTTYYSCNNTNYNSINNCKKCSNNNSCSFCQDEYTFINGNKSICITKSEIEGKYIPDLNDTSNYIKCSAFINNCNICNTTQCKLCNEQYIFIDDNFSECIEKDLINFNFYFTNDNITYYSCNNTKYKDNENCKIISETSDILNSDYYSSELISDFSSEKLEESTQKISKISTTIIDELNVKSSILSTRFVLSTNTLLINTDTTNNTTTTPESTILSTIPTTLIKMSTVPTTNENENSTIIKNEKIIYVLQIQIINRRLKIFIIANFPISKDELFTFVINLYSTNSGRILQQNNIKEMNFTLSEDYNGNADSILVLTSNEEISEDSKAILTALKTSNDIKVKFNENENNLDTEKVKEEINNGRIDYSNLSPNYKIYHYTIVSSTEGCEFNLIAEENIQNSNNTNITIIFIEKNNNKNNITAKCRLSSSYGKNIPCTLDKEVNTAYTLSPYLYSDNSETITISQSNSTNNLNLECAIESNSLKSSKKKSGGLSAGAIAGIICAMVAAIAITIVTYILLRRVHNKDISDNTGINMMVNSDSNFKTK